MNAKQFGRLAAVLAGVVLASQAVTCEAQYQRRYQPSRPTVSPYLNLFRPNNNVIPNYQSLVRPEQDALRFRQQQLQYDRRQTQQLDQLRTNLQTMQQPAVTSELVAPTGKGAWFNRSGPSTFQNTSRFYSQSGVSQPITGGGGGGGGGAGGRR
jgi:hypothetical protein